MVALIFSLPAVYFTTDPTFMVSFILATFFFSLSFFLSFIFFYPSLEKGQLFCPQNSKTHCSHLFFLTWSSDQFSNLLKDVVKIKYVSS